MGEEHIFQLRRGYGRITCISAKKGVWTNSMYFSYPKKKVVADQWIGLIRES